MCRTLTGFIFLWILVFMLTGCNGNGHENGNRLPQRRFSGRPSAEPGKRGRAFYNDKRLLSRSIQTYNAGT